jgi:hypothetical protein
MKICLLLSALAVASGCQPAANQNTSVANIEGTPGSPRPTASSSRIPRNQSNSAIGVIQIFEGTLGVTEKKNPKPKENVTLVNIYIARYGNYDGVMFEFAGTEVPSYRVEYVDGLIRSCGSEEVVPVAGEAWLSIKFTGAKDRTEAGDLTIDDMTLPPDVAVLKDFKVVCDSEGRLEFVFGISARNKYQVTERSAYTVRDDQTGIMVEIKHSK